MLSKNPLYRKTKRYTNQLATKIFTIDDARDIVLKVKQLEGLAPKTIENYEKTFNDFDRFFGEKTDVASLTREDARNFMYWQLNDKVQWLNSKRKEKKKGVSATSANTYLSFSKAIFSILVSEEIVEENIFEEMNNIKVRGKKIETLNVEDITKLLRSLNKGVYSDFRLYVLLHTCLDSFGRIQEILSLKKTDIDFETYTVTFTKTKSGIIRIIPISKKTIKLLQELIEETEEFESDYVFLSNLGNQLKPDTARKHLREVVKRAKLEDKVNGFHIFRHTASELFLRQNGSMRVLQKILGHSEIDTTAIYAHVLDDTIKQQHEMFSPLNLIDDKEKRKTTRKGKLNR